ncbi:hypothetical protein DL98DRAFT_304981 [Cadophora sp. DSE1049]|nr:hypothetical protein DL98DRAFT_304981 [Cadophora sp. DSE1049]
MSRLCLSCLFPSSLISASHQSKSTESRHQQPSSESASQKASRPASRQAHAPFPSPNQHFNAKPATNTHKASYGFTNQTNNLFQLHRPIVPQLFHPPCNSANHLKSHQLLPLSTISVCNLVAPTSSLPLSTPTTLFLQAQTHERGKPGATLPALHPLVLLTDACHRLVILIASINTHLTMISEIRSCRFWRMGVNPGSRQSRHHEQRWL